MSGTCDVGRACQQCRAEWLFLGAEELEFGELVLGTERNSHVEPPFDWYGSRISRSWPDPERDGKDVRWSHGWLVATEKYICRSVKRTLDQGLQLSWSENH